MTPIRITMVTVGRMPTDLHLSRVRSWKSAVFQIVGSAESYEVTRDADGPDWQYSDAALESLLPVTFEGDFSFAIVNVPLTDNYYGRRLSGNRVVVSLHEVADILRGADIPLENGILRLLYAAALVFARFGRQIPPVDQNASYTHDETRGCLFDMNAYKADLSESCAHPSLCDSCETALRAQKVSGEVVAHVKRELRRIRKPLYFRLREWIRTHPILALALSAMTASVLGILSSVAASYVYAWLVGR